MKSSTENVIARRLEQNPFTEPKDLLSSYHQVSTTLLSPTESPLNILLASLLKDLERKNVSPQKILRRIAFSLYYEDNIGFLTETNLTLQLIVQSNFSEFYA